METLVYSNETKKQNPYRAAQSDTGPLPEMQQQPSPSEGLFFYFILLQI